jgi:murein DD-endopeptidase MepM/ murein hydrolase activator NlpD
MTRQTLRPSYGGRPYPPGVRRFGICAVVLVAGLWLTNAAASYPWPLKPFTRMHPLRGAFDDPRYHLGPESSLSAFHFGVDIAAKDGTRVYAVSPGYVHRYADHVTVQRQGSGRAFGYWHIVPKVRTGQHVRLHQLLGTVRRGWGHVHFAESIGGLYRNPLRRGALTPFVDHVPPTIASIGFVDESGEPVPAAATRGIINVEAEIYDTPPVRPAGVWSVARLAPALVMWRLLQNGLALTDWTVSVDFTASLLPAGAYPYTYAPGTYQNKPNRPGRYVFWITHELDTSTLPNGQYTIEVLAKDNRFNEATLGLDFTVLNP